jgi:hypothetical protein
MQRKIIEHLAENFMDSDNKKSPLESEQKHDLKVSNDSVQHPETFSLWALSIVGNSK